MTTRQLVAILANLPIEQREDKAIEFVQTYGSWLTVKSLLAEAMEITCQTPT
jgi:hypothetical protein